MIVAPQPRYSCFMALFLHFLAATGSPKTQYFFNWWIDFTLDAASFQLQFEPEISFQMFNIDWEPTFSVGPLGTDPLGTPVAASFGNFLWPSTPSHANIMNFGCNSHPCWAKPISGPPPHKFLKFWHGTMGVEGLYNVSFLAVVWGPKSAFGTHRWQTNFGRSNQVIIAWKLGSHTPKACFNTCSYTLLATIGNVPAPPGVEGQRKVPFMVV